MQIYIFMNADKDLSRSLNSLTNAIRFCTLYILRARSVDFKIFYKNIKVRSSAIICANETVPACHNFFLNPKILNELFCFNLARNFKYHGSSTCENLVCSNNCISSIRDAWKDRVLLIRV